MKILRQERVLAEATQRLSIRCSFTDVFVRDVQVSIVFFYDHRLDTAALKRGLARVLGDFAPFNARLRRRGVERFIECGEAGASFSSVESPRTLQETLAQLDDRGRLELVEVIAARKAWTRGDPVLAVRVTQFAGGQSALGVSWHHTAGDLHSVMRLMRAWSCTVAGVDYDKPLLVDDREDYLHRSLPDSEQIPPNLRYMRLPELSKLAAYMVTKSRDKRRITFHFEPEELERMHASMQAECPRRLTINDAISAHVSSVVSSRDAQARDRRLSIAVNFRKRVGLPENVLGNMVSTIEAECAWGRPAGKIAADLRSALDEYADKHMNHRANLRLIQRHGGLGSIARFIPTGVDPFSGSLLVSNWSGFGIYDLDFGAARPSHFLIAGTGPIPWLGTMYEGFKDRGMLVELELPRAVCARMQDAAGLRELHRFRDPGARLPEAQASLAWVC